jgi:hypothetical protein
MRAALARAEEHGLDFDAAQAVDGLAASARAAGDPSWSDTAADAQRRLERLGVVTPPFSARLPASS